jgi:hypothetical protein
MPEDDALKQFPWRVLTDEAVESVADDYFQIHSAYAHLLLNIARECATPFCIGLYSSWGSGKTSVAKILRKLVIEEEPQSLGFVYLDVWKYSADPLKRWILLETQQQLENQNILHEYRFGGRDLQSHLEFEEQWKDETPLRLNLATITKLGSVLTLLSALSFPLFVLLAALGPLVSEFWKWLFSVSAWIAGISGIGLLIQFIVKKVMESLKGLVFTRMTKHVTAKPAFSSEQFGTLFRDIVAKAKEKLPGGKIIFVFDNLDRCPEHIAVEAIGVLKTYLDESGCIYVIPCDQAALIKHISRSYITQSDDQSDAGEYANEFLNKFFQMTLRLPASADIEIDDYINHQLKVAGMTDLSPEAKDVLSLGYRGETPRQVKRVLNDLIGYRALANEVETTGLIEAGALTGNLPLLTKMCVISVHWPSFLEKLTGDPELWSETMQKIEEGTVPEGLPYPPPLLRFLHATRHVSPEADIRPYLFLEANQVRKGSRSQEEDRGASEKWGN